METPHPLLSWGYRSLVSFFRFKLVFSDSAYRAYPVVGNIFELCSGRNSAIGVAYCRVIDPTAHSTYIFVHSGN